MAAKGQPAIALEVLIIQSRNYCFSTSESRTVAMIQRLTSKDMISATDHNYFTKDGMGSIPASPNALNVPLLLCQERFNEASLPGVGT